MSLILDALRRAEREHPRDLARHVSAAPWPRAARARKWIPAAVALVIVAAALVVAGWWIRTTPAPVTADSVTAVPAPRPAAPAPRQAPERSTLDDIAPQAGPATVETEPAPATHASAVPFLDELPVDVRATIPAMTLNAHVWSEDPDRRFVMIDMQRYRIGDTVKPGLRLVGVLPEGVELDWRGTRFRLARR